jgi:hypothetical protein
VQPHRTHIAIAPDSNRRCAFGAFLMNNPLKVVKDALSRAIELVKGASRAGRGT